MLLAVAFDRSFKNEQRKKRFNNIEQEKNGMAP